MSVVLTKLCVLLVIASVYGQKVSNKKDLEVLNKGLLPIESGDVGFSIYVTVLNVGDTQIHVVCKMIECCESQSDDETDCSFMHLIGGNMGFVSQNVSRNMTLLFPNMYPYNRRGDCLIAIWYRNRYNVTSEVRTSVSFDTYSSAMDSMVFRRMLSKKCDGPDLDPLNNCLPADCHQKYNGEKTYFSRIRNKCIPSPACYADPNKNMPDIAYLPVSNMCRDLENPITEEDVRYLTKVGAKHDSEEDPWKNKDEDQSIRWSELNLNIRCHHGVMSNKTGLCHCDEGWTSPPIKDNLMISSTLLFHMCTIKKSSIRLFNFGYFANKFFAHGSKILLSGIGLSLLALLLLCLCFPSFDASYICYSDSDDDDSESETKHRNANDDSCCAGICDSDDSLDTVDTCYILMDKAGRELYTTGVNHNVYQAIIDEIILEFSCQPNMLSDITGRKMFDRSRKHNNISTSSTSSCSDFLIESDRSSIIGENIDDTDILATSGDSEWELENIAKQTQLTHNEERMLLNDYINDSNQRSSQMAAGLRPPTIEGSSSIFEVQRTRPYSDNNLPATSMCNQLSRELASILNSSRNARPLPETNAQMYRK